MTMFRDSSALELTYKVFAWGPEGAGKSHLLHSAPEPAVIDVEHRSDKFKDTFAFKHVAPESFTNAAAAIAELAKGTIACKSIGLDGASKLYEAAVKRFSVTARGQSSDYLKTDWPAVNRTMLEIFDPLFLIPGRNIIVTGKQIAKLTRRGNDFDRDGVKFIGDNQRWPFYFDFVLHYAGRGLVEVQKSMSAHLPVGTNIKGDLDWARFMRLVTGEESLDGKIVKRTVETGPPGDVMDQDVGHRGKGAAPSGIEMLLINIDPAHTRQIIALAHARKLTDANVVTLIGSVAGANTPLLPDDVAQLMDALKKQVAA